LYLNGTKKESKEGKERKDNKGEGSLQQVGALFYDFFFHNSKAMPYFGFNSQRNFHEKKLQKHKLQLWNFFNSRSKSRFANKWNLQLEQNSYKNQLAI
jgi:hypothetical protein